MATKWDPLVLKYQRQNQQELGRLTELRRHLKETESNRDKVAERQMHFRRQLHTNTLREIDDWRVMKSFLADLDILRNNCEGQLIEIRELIDRAQAQNQGTAQILQKYEHLQQQTLNARRIYRERHEIDALDEWAVQSYARSDLARDLHVSLAVDNVTSD
jgi:flagellar biosynthesis chaperone FliJ